MSLGFYTFNLILKFSTYTLLKIVEPFSIVCAASKVFEQIIYNKLYNFVANSITEEQLGFDGNLFVFTNYANDTLEKRLHLDSFYWL